MFCDHYVTMDSCPPQHSGDLVGVLINVMNMHSRELRGEKRSECGNIFGQATVGRGALSRLQNEPRSCRPYT